MFFSSSPFFFFVISIYLGFLSHKLTSKMTIPGRCLPHSVLFPTTASWSRHLSLPYLVMEAFLRHQGGVSRSSARRDGFTTSRTRCGQHQAFPEHRDGHSSSHEDGASSKFSRWCRWIVAGVFRSLFRGTVCSCCFSCPVVLTCCSIVFLGVLCGVVCVERLQSKASMG